MKTLKDITAAFSAPAVSVDFGRVYLKIILFSRGRAAACGAAKITVSDPAAAESFIKEFIARQAPGCKRAYLTLPDNEGMLVKHLEIPVVPAAKITGVAEWQLKDDLPGGQELYNIAWELNGEFIGQDGGKKYRLATVSAAKERIEAYLDIISACGLRTEGISYAAFNYGRMLRRWPVASASVDAVLDVGDEDSFISIYKGGRLAFLRRLPFSSRKLAASLTTSFVAGSRKVEYSLSEALNINETFGVVLDEGIQIGEDVRGSHIVSLMRPALENLLRDIKSSFSYFCSFSGESSAQRLILAGGGADIKNLGVYLSRGLGIGSAAFPRAPFCALPLSGATPGQFLSAAGAAIQDNSSADLLPGQLKKQLRLRKEFRLACAGTAFLLIILAVLFLYDRGKVFVYRREAAEYAARLQSLDGIRAVRSVIEAGNALISNMRADNVPPEAVMKAVSSAAGGNIYLDELSLGSEKREVVLKGTVNASAQDAQRSLAEFADALKATGMFPDISLKYSSRGQETSGFEITCRFLKKAL
ncbi:MAG: pilus assembly protein PilM [Candidatus Omnitrophota bacterium]|jgi:Tfp pilus assembly PilM family ATPase